MNGRFTTSIAMARFLLLAGTPEHGFALNEATHEIVNEQALRNSNVPTILREQLGMERGIDQQLGDKKIFQWVREGGSREDQGNFLNLLSGTARFLRHFHDPLQPWDTAGLSFFGKRESSVRWMQRADQGSQAVGGNWAWQDAREHYRKALTSSDPTTREQEGADTFRALGQLMHLVTDASVPEHTRNDAHPLGGLYGNYEYWVAKQHRTRDETAAFIAEFLANPFGPDPAILQQPTGDNQAAVPVARLIDTNIYLGLATGPNVTPGRAIGIAEVAHINLLNAGTEGWG